MEEYDQQIEAAVLASWAVKDLDGTGLDEAADPARSIPRIKKLMVAYANKQVVAELEAIKKIAPYDTGTPRPEYMQHIYTRIEELSSSVALSHQPRTEGDSGSSKPQGAEE